MVTWLVKKPSMVLWLLVVCGRSFALGEGGKDTAELIGPKRYHTRGVLQVGVPLERVKLPAAGGRAQFELQGLKRRHGYEVKISFPGSVPATYEIELVSDNPESGQPGRRRLLDTEKLVFSTDDAGRPLRGSVPMQPAVIVTVRRLGVVAGGRVPPTEALFNIELEELSLGIPRRSWWVAFLALLSLAGVFLVMSCVPYQWLTGDCVNEVPKTQ